MKDKNFAPGEFACFDEKPFRPFMLWLNSRTLHWTGARSVPKNKKHGCKVCLSVGICWYGDGTYRIVVVYRGSGGMAYEDILGVIWLRADTKWTRKTNYRALWKMLSLHVWILRAVIRIGTKVAIHDSASSHGGEAPTLFLKTMGVEKVIKIPRNATWVLAPADHGNLNGQWSRVAGQVVADFDLKAKLAGHFKKKGFSSFTKEARTHCSEVLAEIASRMSTEEAMKLVRRGWQQTFLGTRKEKHKDLKVLLKLGEKLPRRKPQPLPKHECPLGCGERWNKPKNIGTKALAKHKKACWCCREHLLAPSDPCAKTLNEPLPLGLRATAEHKGTAKELEFVALEDGTYETRDAKDGTVLEKKWWQNAKALEFKKR